MAIGSFAAAALVALLASGAIYVLHTEVDEGLKSPIRVMSSSEELEQHLYRYRDQIGPDLAAYRNHCLRVLSYAMHFLHGDQTQLKVLAAGLAYHDIGLWTDAELSYLEPSIARAKADLPALGFNEKEMNVVTDIILWHHKVTQFTDADSCKDHECAAGHTAAVEAARKADWIDATTGLLSKGMPREHIARVQAEVPNAGFHQLLLEFGFKLHRWNLPRHLEVLRIFRW